MRQRIVELTRFNADDVEVCAAVRSSANAVASFAYTISIDAHSSDGTGPTGSGRALRRDDNLDTVAESEQVAKKQRDKLAAFASSQAQSLVPAFDEAQFAVTLGYAFLSHPCMTCSKTGQQTCDHCSGLLHVNCDPCFGRGTVNCSTCHGSSFVTESCHACHGSGSRYEYVNDSAWNPHTGQYEHITRNVLSTCSMCYGNPTKSVRCQACQNGQSRCTQCQSTGKKTCPKCAGSGMITCTTCSGTRGSHHQYLISSNIQESSSVDVADLAEEHWVRAYIGAKTPESVSEWDAPPPELESRRLILRRNLTIPHALATATVGTAGSETFELRAVGPELTICDYAAIGDLILGPEIERLATDTGLAEAKTALKDLAASGINRQALEALCSAERSAPPDVVAEKFAAGTDGFVSAGHVERLYKSACALVTNAFSRAHRRGLPLALLLGAIALVAMIVMTRIAPGHGLPVWIPLAATVLVALSTELVARVKGPLGVRIAGKYRGAALLQRTRLRAWAWRSSYLAAGLALTWIALHLR